jgi:two-component system chemotaxis response regulator CheY
MGKILVVDDDKLIVTALSIRLRSEGHEVLIAYDATAAVEMARIHAFSLIVMDINLPFSSGTRAVRQIRDVTGSSATPVIFLTASKVPGLRDQATALGAVGFLEKPYDADELMTLVKTAMVGSLATNKMSVAAANRGVKGKVLVVDEDKNAAKLVATRLGVDGYDALIAQDVASAAKTIESQKPLLLVIGISPPHSNGLQTYRDLRDEGVSAEIPFVFITASRIEGLREKAEALGAAGFLEKPYDGAALLALVQKALHPAVKG